MHSNCGCGGGGGGYGFFGGLFANLSLSLGIFGGGSGW
jgi:hypothetical protein